MAYRKLPDGLYAFVRDNAPGRSSAELAEMVNATFGTTYTPKGMKGYMHSKKIKSGIQPKPPTVFPDEVRAFILENYEGVRFADMAAIVNDLFGTEFPVSNMRWFYQNNGLKSGIRVNPNQKPIGSITRDKDGLLRQKTEDGSWRLVHHLVWEEHNGKIPAGQTIIFADGNADNTSIDNLMLTTRAELMKMNTDGLRFSDPQLQKTGLLIAKVRLASNQRRKEKKQ